MNTNNLKKFAQAARTKLIEQVSAKLNFVLTHDTSELRGKADTITRLNEEIKKYGKDSVIEKVAYTWFNRLVALRFMDANGYQPIGISVVSPAELTNSVSPQLLSEAHSGNIPTELNVNKQTVLDILDGRQASNNPDNDVYRLLLVAACNNLSTIFPFLFERIEDYTELLLPDDLTSPFSFITDIVNGMSTEDCQEVEVIGWLYQFYISEKKDEVFASKSAVKKEDIPAATQLFTPRWIVEYMVQNTLGKLWLQNRPNSGIKQFMPYYIKSPSGNSTDYLKINSVEEIRLLDQACGSGHILVYSFDLFAKIYEEEGYNASDIPQLILENNLNGFEIDERAAQLSGFALMMKARSYNRRFFRKEVKPNILCYKDLELTVDEIKFIFSETKIELTDSLLFDLTTLQQATNFGSLIRPKTTNTQLQSVLSKLTEAHKKSDIFSRPQIEKLLTAFSQLIPLSQTYHCAVANPPYMGSAKMNIILSEYVKINFPISKADLFSCFIERSIDFVPKFGFNGLVTMESWMFLSSFEDLRKKIIDNTCIHSLSHFGWHIMRIAFGTVSFILENKPNDKDCLGVYSYMEYDNIDKGSETPIEFPVKNNGRYKEVNQKDFEKIPGSPIGYWVSKKFQDIFIQNVPLKQKVDCIQGIITGDTNKYLKFWQEIELNKFSVHNSIFEKDKYWISYTKGGTERKWFGNNSYVVNWKNNGNDLVRSRNTNSNYYLKPCITWTLVTSANFSARYCESGFLWDVAGSIGFVKNEKEEKLILAILCSKLVNRILKVLNPTINTNIENIEAIPIAQLDTELLNLIDILVNTCLLISKNDWDCREISWSFLQNELIRLNGQDIEESFDLYQQYWKTKFFQLHQNEEELNRQFIEIYGLQDELTPDVRLEDITILKQETSIENSELVFHADDVFQQFVSYAVGCMFGRYSLDKEGLTLANQGETLEDYIQKFAKSEAEVSFLPDEDNIIPVLDDEWFEDDIVARFHVFLKASFGEKNFAKNLAFVEDCLGKDVRKYFTKDFYKDHVQRYKKRPIYWMFSSPKGYFNVLVYLHRYTPDTINRILNSYLKEFIEKLTQHRKQQEHIVVVGSATEQNKAQKEIDKIDLMLADCRQYEIDILYPLATERIALDMDDGVLVNYNKLGNAVAAVAGLNDKVTKKKVREFDWIDGSFIR